MVPQVWKCSPRYPIVQSSLSQPNDKQNIHVVEMTNIHYKYTGLTKFYYNDIGNYMYWIDEIFWKILTHFH